MAWSAAIAVIPGLGAAASLVCALPAIPAAVPAALAVILLASSVMFWLLVRRWTADRAWQGLTEWAQANRFMLRGEKLAVAPEVVRLLSKPEPRILLSLNDADTTLVQIETPLTPAASPEGGGPAAATPARWNLLVRKLESAWPMTGLRPQGHAHSVLDFFPLHDMQAMSPSERFVLYGAEARSARILARSAVRGLMPPDIGLILVGHSLVLDFSARQFDALTVQRIDALAEQLVTHLPAGSA
jgi:hypothetical protein